MVLAHVMLLARVMVLACIMVLPLAMVLAALWFYLLSLIMVMVLSVNPFLDALASLRATLESP